MWVWEARERAERQEQPAEWRCSYERFKGEDRSFNGTGSVARVVGKLRRVSEVTTFGARSYSALATYPIRCSLNLTSTPSHFVLLD